MRYRRSGVLEPGLDLDDDALFTLFDRILSEDLDANGFDFAIAEDETYSDGSSQLVWEDDGERANVSCVRTGENGFSYCVVTAAKRIDARHVFEALGERVAFVPLEELQDDARRRLMFFPEGLEKVAIAAGERSDPVSLELIRDGLEHRGPRVRLHAARAAARTRWHDLVDDLERMIRVEPDAEVLEAAEAALVCCRPPE
jgi:hypothetical protein